MTEINIILRPVTMKDAELLYLWRNDIQTRSASINMEILERDSHIKWLKSVLENKNYMLYIAEVSGSPVGTVRAYRSDNNYEISWTVAPNARGQGFGCKMVTILTNQINHTITAKIKKDNFASIRIAEKIGMQLTCEKKGILHYYRPSIKNID